MNESKGQHSLDQMVKDYYAERPLPQATLRRLMDLSGEHTRSAPRRWLATAAMAAGIAVAAFGLGYVERGRVDRAAGSGGKTVMDAPGGPSLVAVQIHADWCRRSPTVAPIFADLMTKYGNEPVLFVTLDITDDVRREQARLLASNLGVPQALDEPFESGMIKLIDRESNALLAVVTDREQTGALEVRLAEALLGHHGADYRSGT